MDGEGTRRNQRFVSLCEQNGGKGEGEGVRLVGMERDKMTMIF